MDNWKDMKMTLVSIFFRGKRFSAFVPCSFRNGKAIVTQNYLDKILNDAGVKYGMGYCLG